MILIFPCNFSKLWRVHLNSFCIYLEELPGKMQSNNIGPKRSVVPQRVASRNSVPDVDTLADRKKSDSLKQNQAAKVLITHTKNTTVVGESHEDASVTPPSISGTITSAYDDNLIPFGLQRDFKPIIVSKESNPSVESQLVDGQKKVQFLTGDDANGQGNAGIPKLFHFL